MPISIHLLSGLILGALGVAVALTLVHGLSHMTANPGASAIFLVMAGAGIGIATLVISLVLRLATGGQFAALWWRILVPLTLVAMVLLYVIETRAL